MDCGGEMAALAEAQSFSFVDRVTRVLERVDYRRADSIEDKEAIYRLRHTAYVREGALQPTFTRKLSDAFDDLQNTWIFGIYIDEALCGSFRLHISLPGLSAMPAADVFPEIIGPEIAAGKTLVDPTRFVADAESARRFPELPYITVRLGYMAAEYFSADYVLAAVRSEHQAFYRRVFGHQIVCPPRQYLTLTKPLSLMMLHYPPARQRIVNRYPFFRSTFFERRMLFERPKLELRQSAA
jgi:hypothetical protein